MPIDTLARCLTSLLIFSFAHYFVPLACADPQVADATLEQYAPTRDPQRIDKFAFQRYLTKDRFGRQITFYLSREKEADKNEAKPIVVCVQGSGSQSLFLKHQGRIASAGPEAVVLRDFRNRVRVLVVEKPGVPFLFQPSAPGSAVEAPDEYRREFSLPRWVEAIHAAIQAARQLPDIDTSRMLVLGHSEGGQVACEVAAVDAKVTHVACMAGGGPTQLFDLIAFARSGDMYDPNATAEQRIEALMADWQKVLDEPDATDKHILGHSHLRWSSFLKSSPIDAVLKSQAKVFIAQGTGDVHSLPASADVLYAELLARGRQCTYRRIEGGDHAFMQAGDNGDGWAKTNGEAVEWFLNDR